VDVIGLFVLTGITVSASAALLGGGPKLVLIRESFVTGALGVICLISLRAPRPLLFFVARDFSTGHDPARMAEFNALWQSPAARHVFRVMTVVWGVGWVGEFALKVLIVTALSITQALVVGPIESTTITVLLIAWSIRYGRASRERAQRLKAAAAP